MPYFSIVTLMVHNTDCWPMLGMEHFRLWKCLYYPAE